MRHFLKLFLIRPNRLLAHREIATLVNMVQVVPAERNQYTGAQPGTIAPLMSWPYDTQPWLVRCDDTPCVAVNCSVLQCVVVCIILFLMCFNTCQSRPNCFQYTTASSAQIMWFSGQHGWQSDRRTWISHKMRIVNC